MTPTPPLPLRSFPFSGTEVTAVVSTRHGGVSTGAYATLNLGDHVGDDHEAVMANRRRLCAALGTDRLTVADQRHGARVAVVDAALAGRGHDGAADAEDAFPATDALVTDLPGVAVTMGVADCAPVVVYDPDRRAVGVAHCGRAGTVLGMLPATIEAMRGIFGSVPESLLIGIGPAIGAGSYEIGDAQAVEIIAAFGKGRAPGNGGTSGRNAGTAGSGGLLTPTRPGHCTFDLVGALRIQLRESGVPDANVHVMDVDTRTRTDEFFSDRAARPCGRFMLAAMLPA